MSFADATNGHTHDGTTGGGQKIPTAGLNGLTSSSSGVVKASGSNTFSIGGVTLADLPSITATKLLGNPTGSAAVPSEISLGATLAFSGTALQTAALTGDITTPANSFVTTIGAGKVTNAMLAGSIASSKLVGTDISTVGTITAGTWSSTITGAAIDSSVIGGTTKANGSFTNLTATTSAILDCTGVVSMQGGSNVTISPTANVIISPSGTVTISSTTLGSLNNVTIGASTASTGKFTTLQSNYLNLLSNAAPTNGINLITANTIGIYANSSVQARVLPTTSAVNYLTITGSTAGNKPIISVDGTDTDVGIAYSTKGAGIHQFIVGGATIFQGVGSSTNVNYFNLAGGNTGSSPAISAQGSDAAVGLTIYTAGTGSIDFYTDNLASRALTLLRTASAVNYLSITGSASAAGNTIIAANGSDTNINITLTPKGTGAVKTPKLQLTSTAGIVGTATNDSADAGAVGEVIRSDIAAGSAVVLTSGTPANVTSISLTAGDWDVCGEVGSSNAAGTTITYCRGGISTTSGTYADQPSGSYTIWTGSTAGTNSPRVSAGTLRLSLAATTTVYLIAQNIFSGSTSAAYGGIWARRAR